MISSIERPIVIAAASASSLAVAFAMLRTQKAAGLPLACSTIALTGVLLCFYHTWIREPSHGIGILILPVATGWLWWRKRLTGKPDFSPGLLILLQCIVGVVYALAVWLQEH